MDTCFICGGAMTLYSRANYSLSALNRFAFSSRKIPEYMHYDLYECKACKVLCADQVPGLEKLAEAYEKADFDSMIEAKKASRTYIQYLKQYISNIPKGRALDIGTGEGSYLKCLLEEGVHEVVGIEPSQAPIDAADSEVRPFIIKDVFRATLFKKSSFDMISCFQTIEHIPESRRLLEDIYALLKEHGLIYIVCHDYCSVINQLLGMKSPIFDIEHLQLFSSRSICRLLSQCGYKNVKSFSIRNGYSLKYWLKLFPFPMNVKQKILDCAERYTWGGIEVGINVGNIAVIGYK